MRRRFLLFLTLLLCFSPMMRVRAEEEAVGSFVVVEEEDEIPNPRDLALGLMRSMTLEEKVCQLFIVAPEALTGETRTTSLPDDQNVFSAYPVGGVVLFGQNIVSEGQLSALTAAINALAASAGVFAPFIAVDEEGGAVSRVANKLGYELAPSPSTLGQSGDAATARASGAYIASYLARFGINLDFAPVADVLIVDAPEIGERSFGQDPAAVSALSAALAEGLRAGGVIPCYKHFPGHGAVSGNTHTDAVSTRRTIPEMRGSEWVPFADGIADDIEMVMTSHLIARGAEDDEFASLSYRVTTEMLRQTLGYDGVVITDALRMRPIAAEYKPGEAAVKALQAGADLLLLPGSLPDAVKGVLDALEKGTLSQARLDESVSRVLALKIQWGIVY